ncbi:MAG: ATPase central domain protein [Sphaerisporangium sp.]|nr:ATPase central domain protein [Sphaerisporangium sp.]
MTLHSYSHDALEASSANRHTGVSKISVLPKPEWSQFWDRTIYSAGVKSRLLNFMLFSLVMRERTSMVGLPTHGLALLAGPPGTGKTTLCYGLANRAAEVMREKGLAERVIFVTVDPHAFPSEMLGGSQRASAQLFERAIPDIALEGSPVVVLLDEVEALAVNRRQASTGANPIDVHRTTQAVLTGLDSLARECRNTVLVATTNHIQAVDGALISRADVVEHIGLPTAEVIREILIDTLTELELTEPVTDDALSELADLCFKQELDARQTRKLVLRALISGDSELALTPTLLSAEHLRLALSRQ